MTNLPSQLEAPIVVSRRVAAKMMLDLTVYLAGPSVEELEELVRIYHQVSPNESRVLYSIAELHSWAELARPRLTATARAAAAAGIDRPYLEPVRNRIREGRAFELQYWDRRPIEDPEGSWSFRCRSIHLRSTGLHAFVRILIPLKSDPEILRTVAHRIAERVEFYSGHGGLAFVYDPWLKSAAMDAIYARARRFWGVDVEDLNGTLPLMKQSIKGVGWVTMLGHRLGTDGSVPKVESAMSKAAAIPGITVDSRTHGTVFTLGSEPVAGDQHRPDHSLDPYYALAGALEPLFLESHPDFPGERFIENGNTVGWMRRFIDPSGWR